MLGQAWVPAPTAWSLDGVVIQVRQPSLKILVSMVISDDCIPLVFGTIVRRLDAAYLGSVILSGTREVDMEDLEEVADIFAQAWFGRPRWEAARLWQQTLGAWSTIDGELLTRGVNVMDLPPDRATNAVFTVWRKLLGGDAQKWDMWLAQLQAEPLRVIKRRMMRESAAEQAALWEEAEAQFAAMEAAATGVDSEIIDTSTDTLT